MKQQCTYSTRASSKHALNSQKAMSRE
jgi:hypothetical protein